LAEKCIFVKVWNVRKGELMVAACDCELIGKKLKEGGSRWTSLGSSTVASS